MFLKVLVLVLAAAYVLHRWVPRVRVTWPMVLTFVALLLGVRALGLLSS